MTPVGWARPLQGASNKGMPMTDACSHPLKVELPPFSLVTTPPGVIPVCWINSSMQRIMSAGATYRSLAAGAPTMEAVTITASGSISSNGVKYRSRNCTARRPVCPPDSAEPPPPPPKIEPPSMAYRTESSVRRIGSFNM